MQTQHQMATNPPQMNPTNVGYKCLDKGRLLLSAFTVAIYYDYSAWKWIFVLPSHGGWKAEYT